MADQAVLPLEGFTLDFISALRVVFSAYLKMHSLRPLPEEAPLVALVERFRADVMHPLTPQEFAARLEVMMHDVRMFMKQLLRRPLTPTGVMTVDRTTSLLSRLVESTATALVCLAQYERELPDLMVDRMGYFRWFTPQQEWVWQRPKKAVAAAATTTSVGNGPPPGP